MGTELLFEISRNTEAISKLHAAVTDVHQAVLTATLWIICLGLVKSESKTMILIMLIGILTTLYKGFTL